MRRNKLVAHFEIGEAWDRFSKNNKKKVHNHTKTNKMVSKIIGKLLLTIHLLVYYNSIFVDSSGISTDDDYSALLGFSKSAKNVIESRLTGNLNQMRIWWKVDWIYPLQY